MSFFVLSFSRPFVPSFLRPFQRFLARPFCYFPPCTNASARACASAALLCPFRSVPHPASALLFFLIDLRFRHHCQLSTLALALVCFSLPFSFSWLFIVPGECPVPLPLPLSSPCCCCCCCCCLCSCLCVVVSCACVLFSYLHFFFEYIFNLFLLFHVKLFISTQCSNNITFGTTVQNTLFIIRIRWDPIEEV